MVIPPVLNISNAYRTVYARTGGMFQKNNGPSRRFNCLMNIALSVGALCSRYSFSQVGQGIVMPSASVRWTLAGIKREPGFLLTLLCSRYLFSQAVARQVSSAQMSLTSVFGMGTGGPSSQSTRTSMDGFSPSFISKAFLLLIPW